MSACGDEGGGGATFPTLDEAPTFAVVSTDFQSTSISLLDEEANVVARNWFTSGTTFPGLVAALSGDVVVVPGRGPQGAITVLDRFQTDVITRIRPVEGEVLGQLRTQTDIDYSSNPQDVAFLSARRAFVSRFEPNPDPSEPSEGGTDLAGFDPLTMERTDERVPLSQFDTTVDGTPVPARPESIVELNGRLIVGLSRLAFLPDFSVLGAQGQLAIVDEGLNVTAYRLPDGLENCGAVRPVPGASGSVLVACRGNGSGEVLAASSGLVELSISTSTISIQHLWRPSDGEDRPVAVSSATPIASGRVVAVESGDFTAGTPDVMYEVDLDVGTTRRITSSDGPFRLGQPAWDPRTKRLLVPEDAAPGEVRVYEDDLTADPVRTVLFEDEGVALPPRSVVLVR
jgi:hypothetical protein